jgi:hypothetical protein
MNAKPFAKKRLKLINKEHLITNATLDDFASSGSSS